MLAGSITGEVTVESRGLDGVKVSLSNGATATTAADGSFRFDGIAPGTYQVSISGYPAHAAFGATSMSATVGTEGGLATVAFGASNTDRDALVALYNATDGRNWTDTTNWLTDAPLGDWYGVTTDAAGRASGLSLGGFWQDGEYITQGMRGALPPELGALSELTILDLDGNDLLGGIPAEVGALGKLRHLDLRWNDMSEPLPAELGQLSSLEYLMLYQAGISGEIPIELGSLANLEALHLGANGLTGEIPPELGNLSELRSLGLYHNDLSGQVPRELGNLKQLNYLTLSSNEMLSGPLPLSLKGLPLEQFFYLDTGICVPLDESFRAWLDSLEYHGGTGIDCDDTQGTDDRAALEALYNATDGPNWPDNTNWLTDAPIGDWHGVTTNSAGRVVRLDMNGNQLTGEIPKELGNLASLEELDLNNNYQLTGEIPEELGNLASLEKLWLQGNQLTGEIPEELGNLASLEKLGLSANRLTGGIPEELGNLASLTGLWLEGNELTGGIAEELGSLTNLRGLFLYWNSELAGALPLSLAGLSQMAEFWYQGTSLCVPADESFRAWLNSLDDHRGTGADCADHSDRDALVALYEATDGPNWVNDNNWLSDAPLGDWHGIGVDETGRVVSMNLGGNNLSGELPRELGTLTALTRLNFHVNQLEGGMPRELGALVRLRALYLGWNGIQGEIPPELGNLKELEVLYVSRNQLIGTLPRSLLELERLTRLWFDRNRGLCAPGTTLFSEWLNRIDDVRSGPFCNESDVAALKSLYEATGGANWTRADEWLDGVALDAWQGVNADSLGRVTHIALSGNGLNGNLPNDITGLKQMTSLRIGVNALAGPLPLGLAALDLRELHYADTRLCTPADIEFRAWVNAIPSHEGTATECAPLTDRDILHVLYEATDGPGWGEDDSWLSDEPLREWSGIETDANGRVVSIDLGRNGLEGSLPAELGGLTELTSLSLNRNYGLSGEIPSQLGNLAMLQNLSLSYTDLSGAIPPEFGELAELQSLDINRTGLSGSIPPELGRLGELRSLFLASNGLSGEIPPGLGELAKLQRLELQGNDLSGEIPSERGNLAELRSLSLGYNDLSGEIPPALGDLAGLFWLYLDNNSLSGAIPPELRMDL